MCFTVGAVVVVVERAGYISAMRRNERYRAGQGRAGEGKGGKRRVRMDTT